MRKAETCTTIFPHHGVARTAAPPSQTLGLLPDHSLRAFMREIGVQPDDAEARKQVVSRSNLSSLSRALYMMICITAKLESLTLRGMKLLTHVSLIFTHVTVVESCTTASVIC